MLLQQLQAPCGPAVNTHRCAGFKPLPFSTQMRSSASSSFRTGGGRLALSRAPRRATSSARSPSAPARAFYTQESVPDQTGRVAIVTGKRSECKPVARLCGTTLTGSAPTLKPELAALALLRTTKLFCTQAVPLAWALRLQNAWPPRMPLSLLHPGTSRNARSKLCHKLQADHPAL